eukprot:13112-Heterococcus_DN1.PRE.11
MLVHDVLAHIVMLLLLLYAIIGHRNSSLAVLELRGCTPITSDASRFEINMGQQLVNSGSVEWQ